MEKLGTANFPGALGAEYEFVAFPLEWEPDSIGAVYAFTGRDPSTSPATHEILYVGVAEDINERLSGHEKLKCVMPLGCNCICIHPENSEQARLHKEKDLIAKHNPPCNRQVIS